MQAAFFRLNDRAGRSDRQEAADERVLVLIQDIGDDALLVGRSRSPEEQARGRRFIKAVGTEHEFLIRVLNGNRKVQRLALDPGVTADDEGTVRGVVHEAVIPGDSLVEIGGAGKILTVLCQADFGRVKRQACVADDNRLCPREIDKTDAPVEQIFAAVLAANPVAVDGEIEVLRHTVAVVFRQPEADRVCRRVAGSLIVEAAAVRRVTVGEDRPQAGQHIVVVDFFAVDGVVAAVIRVIFAGLEAVGHLASRRDPVCGSLEIDPGSAGVVGLKVRIHGAGSDDRRIRVGFMGEDAENEDDAEDHAKTSAPEKFCLGQKYLLFRSLAGISRRTDRD